MIVLAQRSLSIPALDAPSRRRVGIGVPSVATLVLLAATAAYLCVELPFAVRLVSILSAGEGAGAVEEIQSLGRVVSGLAIALAAWAPVLSRAKRRDWGVKRTTFALLTVTGVALAVAEIGEKTLVERVSEASGPEFRKRALAGVVLRQDALERREPVLLVASVAALSIVDPSSPARAAARPSGVRAYVASGFPSVPGYREEVAVPVLSGIDKSFQEYRRAVNAREDALRRRGELASNAWNDYWKRLNSRNIWGLGVPKVNERIAAEVRAQGVQVHQGWDPRDRNGFEAAAVVKVSRDAQRAYEQASVSAFGEVVPTGLATADAFVANPVVQAWIKRSLGVAPGAPSFLRRPAASVAALYHPHAEAEAVSKVAQALAGDGTALGSGRPLSGRGEDAVRFAFATYLALLLSATGAIFHLSKLAYHVASAASATAGAWHGAKTAAAAAVLVVLCWLSAAPTPASEAVGRTGLGGHVLGWAMGAHSVLASAGNAVETLPLYDTVAKLSAVFRR